MALRQAAALAGLDRLVADEHAVVLCLIGHLEQGRGDGPALVDQLGAQLTALAAAEARVLGPLCDELGLGDLEHELVLDALSKLRGAGPGTSEFREQLRLVSSGLRGHVRHCEARVLPAVRAAVTTTRLAALGEDFLRALRVAPGFPKPRSPLSTDASGLLDPQAQALLDAYGRLQPQPAETLSVEQARQEPSPQDAVRALLADDRTDPNDAIGSVEEVTIPGGAGQPMPVKVYRPEGEGPFPTVLWLHSGGWVLFDVDAAEASCRGLCAKTPAVVVSPDYRRAPEHPFPAAHDDALAAWRWVARRARDLGGDPARLGIGGESVGGTMAAATAVQLARAGEQGPGALVCVYPMTTLEQVDASMTDSADAKPLTRPALSWLTATALRGADIDLTDPRIDLLGLPDEALAPLPPTLVLAADRDVLRSQGERFAARLRSAGVVVSYTAYRRVMHDFFAANAVLDKAEQAQQETAEHLRQHLSAEPALRR